MNLIINKQNLTLIELTEKFNIILQNEKVLHLCTFKTPIFLKVFYFIF